MDAKYSIASFNYKSFIVRSNNLVLVSAQWKSVEMHAHIIVLLYLHSLIHFSNIGCKISEIILPELQDMPIAHLASIGVEAFCPLNPEINDGYSY